MKCPEIRQKLFPFLDNELEVQENLQILTHLDLCPSCSEYFESEKQLEALVKEKLKPDLDQEGLWHKVKGHLSVSARPALWPYLFGKRLFLWGSAVAAALLMGAGVFYYLAWPGKLNAETLVNQSVQIHQKILDGSLPSLIPEDINQDFQKARAFLSQKTHVFICDHNLAKLGYSHRGARLARCMHVPGRQLATLVYARGENRLSHFMMRNPEISFPQSWTRQIQGTRVSYYFFQARPYKVVIFRNGQNLCLFVGSMNRKQLSDLVRLAAEEMLTT